MCAVSAVGRRCCSLSVVLSFLRCNSVDGCVVKVLVKSTYIDDSIHVVSLTLQLKISSVVFFNAWLQTAADSHC